MNAPDLPADFPEERSALLREADHLIDWLLAQIALCLSPGIVRTLPMLKGILAGYLLPAEAALRRMIHILAAAIPEKPERRALLPRKTGQVPQTGGEESPKRSAFRTPLFRLTEPQPDLFTDHKRPTGPGPRISIPGITPRPAPPPPREPRRPLDPIDLEAKLLRRIDALKAAFIDPIRAARRLQRRLRARPPTGPLIAPINIPGFKSDPLADIGRALLRQLTFAALARPNTS
ncbi:hypothetical protein [Hyphomonas sp.]|uniref:hypothetical protein n=1 Tax=Hyphomonas sp. TaxID=87 RepID=UPI00391C9883